MSETVEGINQACVTCGDLPRLREDPMCIHPFLGEQGVQVDCRPFWMGRLSTSACFSEDEVLGAAVWGYMAHRCPGFS